MITRMPWRAHPVRPHHTGRVLAVWQRKTRQEHTNWGEIGEASGNRDKDGLLKNGKGG